MKITRDAFLYMEPEFSEPRKTFAQCVSCRFMLNNKWCVPLGIKVQDEWTCGLYVPGNPYGGEPRPNVNGKVAGLTKNLVQCQRCKYGGDYCELYEMLNRMMPSHWDLDTNIAPEGCCNAWTPKSST